MIISIDPAYTPYIDALVERVLKSSSKIPKYSKRSYEEINREGIIAEYAVCEMFALDPLETVTRDGSDGGVDIILPGSRAAIDVKSRPVGKTDLIISDRQPLRADICIFASIINPMVARVVGWVSKREFYRNARRHDYGNGNKPHTMPTEEVRPMREIWGAL